VGPRAGLYDMEIRKIFPPPRIEPLMSSPEPIRLNCFGFGYISSSSSSSMARQHFSVIVFFRRFCWICHIVSTSDIVTIPQAPGSLIVAFNDRGILTRLHTVTVVLNMENGPNGPNI
jgi:hypothetical protein